MNTPQKRNLSDIDSSPELSLPKRTNTGEMSEGEMDPNLKAAFEAIHRRLMA